MATLDNLAYKQYFTKIHSKSPQHGSVQLSNVAASRHLTNVSHNNILHTHTHTTLVEQFHKLLTQSRKRRSTSEACAVFSINSSSSPH